MSGENSDETTVVKTVQKPSRRDKDGGSCGCGCGRQLDFISSEMWIRGKRSKRTRPPPKKALVTLSGGVLSIRKGDQSVFALNIGHADLKCNQKKRRFVATSTDSCYRFEFWPVDSTLFQRWKEGLNDHVHSVKRSREAATSNIENQNYAYDWDRRPLSQKCHGGRCVVAGRCKERYMTGCKGYAHTDEFGEIHIKTRHNCWKVQQQSAEDATTSDISGESPSVAGVEDNMHTFTRVLATRDGYIGRTSKEKAENHHVLKCGDLVLYHQLAADKKNPSEEPLMAVMKTCENYQHHRVGKMVVIYPPRNDRQSRHGSQCYSTIGRPSPPSVGRSAEPSLAGYCQNCGEKTEISANDCNKNQWFRHSTE